MIEFVILALAVARLSRLIASDSLLDTPRDSFLTRYPTDETSFGDSEIVMSDGVPSTSRGARVFQAGDAWYAESPYKLAELITCVWCNSVWIGVIVWIAFNLYPDATVLIAAPFALSMIAGFLNDRS